MNDTNTHMQKSNLHKIILHAIVNEKATYLMDKYNQIAFAVNKRANKIQIKEAVEALLGNVEVLSVKTINVLGKNKSFGKKRIAGKRGDYKKAYVKISGNLDNDVLLENAEKKIVEEEEAAK